MVLLFLQVYVVVVSHDADSQLGPVAISFTCGYYRIPVIGVSTRDSTFSDKVSFTLLVGIG